MRILTLKQPWASAIFKYGKDIENRTWRTKYRGELYIHAALSKPTRKDIKAAERILGKSLAREYFPTGAILGKVQLTDVTVDHPSPWAFPGCYHWKLEQPIEIEPIYCSGKLGLWTPDQELLEQLKPKTSSTFSSTKGLQLALF